MENNFIIITQSEKNLFVQQVWFINKILGFLVSNPIWVSTLVNQHTEDDQTWIDNFSEELETQIQVNKSNCIDVFCIVRLQCKFELIFMTVRNYGNRNSKKMFGCFRPGKDSDKSSRVDPMDLK